MKLIDQDGRKFGPDNIPETYLDKFHVTRCIQVYEGYLLRIVLPPGEELYGNVDIEGDGDFLGFSM